MRRAFKVGAFVACLSAMPAMANGSCGKKLIISGGGGFTDRNSLKLLEEARDELLMQLKAASPGVLRGLLPADWTTDRLTKVIGDLEALPRETREREGRELMFDFDTAREKIIALKTFFLAHAWIPPSYRRDPAIRNEVANRLLHETSHLWGNDEAAAELFAERVRDRIYRDLMICHSLDRSAQDQTLVYFVHGPARSVYAGPLAHVEHASLFPDMFMQATWSSRSGFYDVRRDADGALRMDRNARVTDDSWGATFPKGELLIHPDGHGVVTYRDGTRDRIRCEFMQHP